MSNRYYFSITTDQANNNAGSSCASNTLIAACSSASCMLLRPKSGARFLKLKKTDRILNLYFIHKLQEMYLPVYQDNRLARLASSKNHSYSSRPANGQWRTWTDCLSGRYWSARLWTWRKPRTDNYNIIRKDKTGVRTGGQDNHKKKSAYQNFEAFIIDRRQTKVAFPAFHFQLVGFEHIWISKHWKRSKLTNAFKLGSATSTQI